MAALLISGVKMTDYLHGARLPLPDDWSPEGYLCVKVTIPDDPQYLAALTGLLDELRLSRTFARDDTKTGAATVARTWDKALNQRPLETEVCDMPALRINEDTCLLEVECADDQWQTVPTSGAKSDYDPNRDDPLEMPFPEGSEDPETGAACVSGAIAAEGLRRIMDKLDNAYTLGTVVFWLEVFLTLYLLQIARKVAEVITQMTTAVTVYTQEEYHDAFVAFDWDELKEILHCYYDHNGVMSSGSHASLVTDELAPRAGSSPIWAMLYFLIDGVGSVGMTNAVNGTGYGIDSATCEACADHEWTITQDFTVTDGGWAAEGGLAVWADGFGWRPSTSLTHMQMSVPITTGFTTLFERFRVDVVNNTGNPNIGYAIEFLDDEDTVIMHEEIIYTTETGFQWDGSLAGVAKARVYLFYFGADPSLIEVYQAVFEGSGTEPTIG